MEKTEYWKSTGVAEPGGVIDPKSLQLWIDWLVRNGDLEEGTLKPEDFSTNEFNPYANGTYPKDAGPDGQALGR